MPANTHTILLILICFLFLRWATVLLHELGHAIPAILFTGEKATIYIGTYGDPARSIKCSLGKVELWLRYDLFFWRNGVCIPARVPMSLRHQMIFVAGGPIASILVAVAAFFAAVHFAADVQFRQLSVCFCASAIYDVIANLIPSKKQIKLHNGRVTYNDGEALLRLWKRRKAANQAPAPVSAGPVPPTAAELEIRQLRVNITNGIEAGDLTAALTATEQLAGLTALTPADYCNLGMLKCQQGNLSEGIAAFERAAELDESDHLIFNNRGYSYYLAGAYAKAVADFDRALQLGSGLAYTYANRGLAKLKLGQERSGLADIHHALVLDPSEPYVHRSLGVYHLDKGETQQALICLEKARALSPNTHQIDELIAQATV